MKLNFRLPVSNKAIEIFYFGNKTTKIKLINIKDDPITLATTRGISSFESYSLQIWKKLCSSEKLRGVIWDIGGFIGIYSLVAAQSSDDNRIYCFEPSSGPFYRLLTHIQLNAHWNQIFPLKVALSDQSRKVPMFHPFGWYVLGSGDNLSDLYSMSYFEEEVVLEIGDDLVFKNRFPHLEFTREIPLITPPSLMKIDVKGHEPYCLRGMQQTIKESQPVIIIEILSQQHLSEVEKELKDYEWLSILENSQKMLNTPNFDREGSNNFIFCHKDKIDLVNRELDLEMEWTSHT